MPARSPALVREPGSPVGGHPRDRDIRHDRRVSGHATVFAFGAAYLVIDNAARDEVQKHDECEKNGYGRK
ncbi:MULTISPECIES: hypothetical protein [unclassified Rhodococcus (in: high G+C Gram-positive bacteria)]|uniref:hypothetical protein n=1 Tax=unclassified Rhodococcus (in: high G+C Gram-positive bacteria) TaxID=192944 RepID=UPI00146B35DF|nr:MULTISPECIES: hypothetical protein [unclassified Rhodococcus (in: high G+C Gram-positive bacteria)]NMD95601.1 hypothetical protein [Rhodococcus sp. BL-253-APC-6A1W]NME79597.1 hypothetical protein [Rhodococcus sp. 105337]